MRVLGDRLGLSSPRLRSSVSLVCPPVRVYAPCISYDLGDRPDESAGVLRCVSATARTRRNVDVERPRRKDGQRNDAICEQVRIQGWKPCPAMSSHVPPCIRDSVLFACVRAKPLFLSRASLSSLTFLLVRPAPSLPSSHRRLSFPLLVYPRYDGSAPSLRHE